MKINTKKIQKFLMELSDVDAIYLNTVLNYVKELNDLIKKHDLSKERFCELFNIKESEFINFTKGNYDYSLVDMATINAVWMKLESERLELIKSNLEKDVPFKSQLY